MRVLQLIDSLAPGGAERIAVNYANLLSCEIDRSFLCVTRAEGHLKDSIKPEVGYFFLKKKNKFDLRAVIRLIKFIRSHNIEILHAHSTSFFTATLVKLFLRDIKLIWHDHYGNSEFLSHRKHLVLKWCSNNFNHIFSVSKALKAWSEQNLNCKKVSFIPNFAVLQDSGILQSPLKGKKGQRIICLANLRPQKDHFTLLKAFSMVKKHHPNWTLHLVGKDFKDGYSSKIKQTIKTMNLSKSVFVYGSRNDVSHVLKQCDIGVLSSRSEGLPLSLLEYGLAKLPVITTKVGECDRVISKKTEGLIVPTNNYKDLSEAILFFIENSNAGLKAGQALNKKILNNFSPANVISRVSQIYKEHYSAIHI